MSDENKLENGREVEETKEKEVEDMDDKTKSPENIPGSPHPDTDDEEEEEDELPFPGFVARALFMTQDHKVRFWCLRAITHPYPFKTNIYYHLLILRS